MQRARDSLQRTKFALRWNQALNIPAENIVFVSEVKHRYLVQRRAYVYGLSTLSEACLSPPNEVRVSNGHRAEGLGGTAGLTSVSR